VGHRLRQIIKRLNQKCERVEDIIDQERLAYQAYRETVGSANSEPKALLAPAEPPIAKVGRPKMKPQILAGDSGSRVRQLRELAGMSQADLAVAAGVDRKTIISFERGDHRAIPSHRLAIRKILVESLVRAFWPD
jgi:DNA-binding XRE family transcriptional regulator